jgi:hypothetical protein
MHVDKMPDEVHLDLLLFVGEEERTGAEAFGVVVCGQCFPCRSGPCAGRGKWVLVHCLHR